MIYDNLNYKIGITLIKGIGNALAKNLIAYIGSEEGIFKESQKNLAKIPGIGEVLSREIVNADVLKRAEQEVEFITKNKIVPLYFTDRDYPFRLTHNAVYTWQLQFERWQIYWIGGHT